MAQQTSGLELTEDVALQQRGWRVQRAAWLVMVALVVAALLGVFGNGPLSWSTRTGSEGALRVTYDRFARLGGNAELGIDVAVSGADSGSLAVELEASYLEAMVVRSITPEPDAVEAAGEFLRYVFRHAEPGAPMRITFELEPDSAWSASGRVRAAGDEVALDMFVYP